jgi:dimethylhistidine N-methyltransferase
MRTTPTVADRVRVRLAEPSRTASFAADVTAGLTSRPKQLPPRYFYDALGSALFVAITELPEYYVTRTETDILRRHAGEIARAAGPMSRLIELGSGNAQKTQLLIDAIAARQPELVFQPIDVDATVLESSGREVAMRFPSVTVDAICGDYRDIASVGTSTGRTLALFLGSSIGNLDHDDATALLRDVRRVLAPGDSFLIGFDLIKDKRIIEAAYNDALGVTACFNLNLLTRINRELAGNFDLKSFSHRAFLNEKESRIEMHLVSDRRQAVRVEALKLDVEFQSGETIHTENSYKYETRQIDAFAAAAGFRVDGRWTDAQGWFADVLLRA